MASALVLAGVVMDARTISSRSGTGGRVSDFGGEKHNFRDIDPCDPENMSSWLAVERTQALPHNVWSNKIADKNI